MDGIYADDVVIVVRRETLTALQDENWTVVTPHFALGRERGRLVLVHALRPGDVDNDLAMLLDAELFAPGWAGGADTFERLFTGVVLSCTDDALSAWESFYRATLDRLAELDRLAQLAVRAGATGAADGFVPDGAGPTGNGSDVSAPEGTLAAFAPVYRHAGALVRRADTRTLLDLGSCFGFFPLQLAGGPEPAVPLVRAADLSPGTCDLLGRMSVRLGAPIPVLTCDAACVPLPDAEVDTVTLLHVLEHVDAEHGLAVLAEATRLARRSVIVAVPLEDEPDTAFGHVRTISLADLRIWGDVLAEQGPWRATVDEFHGGWLVLDRLLPPRRSPGA